MAAGGFSVGADLRRPVDLRRLEWVEGRRGSLLGFDVYGNLAYRIDPSRATEEQGPWLRLAREIFRPGTGRRRAS